MKNKIKKILLKKESGDAGYLSLAISFVLLVFFAVTLLFIYMYGILAMNTSDNIDLVMTSYCKKMESQGYLTTSEVQDMENQLKEYGMTRVSTSGTGVKTTTKVPYGEKVSITVTGDLDYVNSPSMSSVSGTLKYLRQMLNNNDLGIIRNRVMTKSGTSKC